MDNREMLNKIMDLYSINCCDLTLIKQRISWDQKGHLFTRVSSGISYYWDNYRIITVYLPYYPQVKWSFFVLLSLFFHGKVIHIEMKSKKK
ncbi:MAG: hypothetical protein BM561_07510 [Vibrio sp. MedPE-SWchi]|nr:MAG: hypothetical protein BM561_07510 [Vibrio sp. MedPE-SWchi]